VNSAIKFCAENNKWIGAICAAPSVLGKRGLLAGRRATCFPGYEKYCEGAIMTGEAVASDGKFITAKGAGVAVEFGLELVKALFSEEKAAEISASIHCRE
jgi:4-methyl-5(b-hydroxyethyl)-thiazole monophosphate biosynthesis